MPLMGSSKFWVSISVVMWAGGLGIAGCGDDGPAPPPPVDLRICDIHEPSCQQRIYDAVQWARGTERADAPPVRFITREEFQVELQSEMMAMGGMESMATGLQLLDLLAADTSLGEAVASDAGDYVLAYYDPVLGSVTVVEDVMADPDEALYVIAHEMVHAAQDEDLDLVSFQRSAGDSTDAWLALDHMLEGEATHYGFVVLTRELSGNPLDVDWGRYYQDWIADTLPAVAEAPSPFATVSLLPYPVGGRYVAEVWVDSGETAVRDLYTSYPRTSAGWMNGSAQPPVPGEELTCAPPPAPTDQEVVVDDVLGANLAFAFLGATGMPAQEAWSLSAAWRGDRVAVYDDTATGTTTVAWRLRWATEADAAAFVSWANAADPPLGARVASQDMREALVVASDDASVLDTWPADDCPEASGSTALRLPRLGPREMRLPR